ncbi:hypothetical protein F2P56_009165, partial [Juglans regia]
RRDLHLPISRFFIWSESTFPLLQRASSLSTTPHPEICGREQKSRAAATEDFSSLRILLYSEMEKGNGEVSITFAIVSLTLMLFRVLYVIYWSGKPLRTEAPGALSTLIILGSGGHTAEMINLLLVLQKERFSPRFYIAAATDNMSLQKARTLENNLVDEVCQQKFLF